MTILGKSIIAILLAGVLGGGAYYATNFMKADASKAEEVQAMKVQEQKTPQVVVAVDSAPTPAKTLTEKDMSFSDLMKKGGSYECTVKQSVMGVTMSGKFYIKDGNMSATFSTSVQGKTVDTSMLTKDGYSYTWSSMAPGSGVKTKIPAPGTTASAQVPTSGSYGFDGKNIGSYSCASADVASSVFDIPSSITFKEVK